MTGSAPLAEMGLAPGGTIGFLLSITDRDGTANLKTKRDPTTRLRVPVSWAQKQALYYPNEPNFTFWSDARCFGQLVLE